jgi:histone acetyltransferase (RNA polymerase elongator complex component)
MKIEPNLVLNQTSLNSLWKKIKIKSLKIEKLGLKTKPKVP